MDDTANSSQNVDDTTTTDSSEQGSEATTINKNAHEVTRILPYGVKPPSTNNSTRPPRTRLTAKEKGYITSLAMGKTRRQAVRDNYDMKPGGSVKTLDSVADSIERRPLVMALLNEQELKAQETVVDVMTYARDYGKIRDKEGAQYARVALDGANSLLDRVHGKARQQIEVQSTSVSISIDMSATDDEN